MTEQVNVPKIGPVNKKVLIVVGGSAAAFVGWRYWQARKAASYTEGDTTAPDYTDPGTIPAVDGAYQSDNSYGFGGSSGGTDSGTVDSYGFHGTTNDQWTQYATTQLVASDKWSYTDIVTALGKYLSSKPLSTMEVDIVQAAIAVAGYPPVGSHPVIPASSSSSVSLPAPAGLKATNVTASSVTLSWSSVAGAAEYVVRRGGTEVSSPTSTSAVVTGLAAKTTYAFSVAAVGTDNKEGSSSSVSVTTAQAAAGGGGGGTSTSSANKFPKRRLFYTAKRGDNYSKVAAKYKTGLSGEQLYSYQFSKEAGRTASALAVLKSRGPNLIYAGTTIAVPYPK